MFQPRGRLRALNAASKAAVILAVKYVYVIAGLFCFAVGMAMTVQASLGLASWSVFHQAISTLTGLTFGRVSILVGVAIVFISLFMGIRPTLTTLLNILVVGLMVDYARATFMPVPAALGWKFFFLIAGNVIMGFGTGWYTSSGMGAGPRDGLMLALTRLSKMNVGTIRTIMELTVLVAGFLLGGPVGVGTVIGPFVLGWSVARSFELFRRLERLPWLRWLLRVPVPRTEVQPGLLYKLKRLGRPAGPVRPAGPAGAAQHSRDVAESGR